MDESGYCDTMSLHSNNANDDPTITVTVEPVDLLVEKDGSVLLSNLQSALPGAHGLYYYHQGHKKAVKYDSQSAKIVPPTDGWGARSYFVTLAHGCKASWIPPFGSYEHASKQFERSVTLVQKMLGRVDSGPFENRKDCTTKVNAETPVRSGPVTVVSDQDEVRSVKDVESSSTENIHLETTVDQLNKTLAAKEHDIQLLKEENHELKSQSKERVELCDKLSEENANLRAQIDELKREVEGAQSRSNQLEHSSAEERQKLQSEAAELRQNWNDAKWRVGELEAALGGRDAEIEYKVQRIAQLESEHGCVSDQLRESNQKYSDLEQSFSSKQNEIDQLVDKAERFREMADSLVANNGQLDGRVRQLEQELAEVQVVEEVERVENSELQQSSANGVQERVEDLERQLTELRDSYNRLEQDSTLVRQKLEWELGEVNQWLHDARQRNGELEEHLRWKNEHLDERERTIGSVNEQLQIAAKELDECKRGLDNLKNEYSDMKSKKEYVEQELSAAKKHLADNAQTSSHQKVDAHEDMLELSDELRRANLRKYELENQAAQFSSDLRSARQRVEQLEALQENTAKNCWTTGERLAELERDRQRLEHELSEANRVIDELRRELTERDNRIAQDVPEAHHLNEELRITRENLSTLTASETDARQKLEWQLGEVTQAWNDAKWKMGEMDAAAAHKQWELDQARLRVHELEQHLERLQNFKSKASKAMEDAFLIRKQPYVDRRKWSLSMWDENLPVDANSDYRRVWFDIDASNARTVYLLGSFVNWECGLMCTATEDSGDRKGVWVDLPPGRYEFRFLVDGDWRTASDFPTCDNDFGSLNNWRLVE